MPVVAAVAVVVGHHHPFFPSFLSLNLHDSSASSVRPLSLPFLPSAQSLTAPSSPLCKCSGVRMAQDGLLTALLFPLRSLTLLFPSSDLADVTMWSGVEVELGGMHAPMDGWMDGWRMATRAYSLSDASARGRSLRSG